MPHPTRPTRRSGFFSALIALALTLAIVPVAQAATPRNPDLTEGRAVAPQRYDVEKYILRLMNCIRTGGTLRADAGCTGYGSGDNGGYRAPYKLNKAASDRVARPYAKLLVWIERVRPFVRRRTRLPSPPRRHLVRQLRGEHRLS